jgi:hypothetical protein
MNSSTKPEKIQIAWSVHTQKRNWRRTRSSLCSDVHCANGRQPPDFTSTSGTKIRAATARSFVRSASCRFGASPCFTRRLILMIEAQLNCFARFFKLDYLSISMKGCHAAIKSKVFDMKTSGSATKTRGTLLADKEPGQINL